MNYRLDREFSLSSKERLMLQSFEQDFEEDFKDSGVVLANTYKDLFKSYVYFKVADALKYETFCTQEARKQPRTASSATANMTPVYSV